MKRKPLLALLILILAVTGGATYVTLRETPETLEPYFKNLHGGSLEKVEQDLAFRPWRINSVFHTLERPGRPAEPISALAQATWNKDTKVLQLLLDKGAHLGEAGESGFPALDLALRIENREAHVRALLKAYAGHPENRHGANLRHASRILYSIKANHPETPDLSRDFARIDWSGEPREALEYFLRYLARFAPDATVLEKLYTPALDCTPPLLYWAALYNPEPLVAKVLLDARPELETALPDEDGKVTTPLAVSMKKENTKVTAFLRGRGTADKDGFGAFHALAQSMEQPDLSSLRSLLQDGLSPDAHDGKKPILVHAASHGHFRHLKVLLDHGANPKALAADASNVLHGMARQPGRAGHKNGENEIDFLEAASLLLKAGAPLDQRNEQGEPPLFNALSNGDWRLAELYLQHGADASATDAKGRGACHWLVLSASPPEPRVLHGLLKAGASLEHPDNKGETPLLFALTAGKADAALHLLTAGAKVQSACVGNNTPFHFLAKASIRHTVDKEGRLPAPHPIFALLVKHGIDVNALNSDGDTALYVALVNENLFTALNLVHVNASLDWPDKQESSALDVFLRLEQDASFLPFLEAGANVKALVGDGGPWFRFLDTYWFARGEEFIKKDIEDWQRAGIDLNLRDRSGRTALHRLMAPLPSGRDQIPHEPGYTAIVLFDGPRFRNVARAAKLTRALLQAGASVDALDAQGYTPLERLLLSAPRAGYATEQFIALSLPLLENGASMKPSAAWKRLGVEKFAVYASDPHRITVEALTLMARNGLDFNKKDANGRDVALQLLERSDIFGREYIQIAITHGWDAFAKDNKGNDALDYLNVHYSEPRYTEVRGVVIRAREAQKRKSYF